MRAARGYRVVGAVLVVLGGLVLAEGLPDWLPRGGDQLLVEVLGTCGSCDDLATLGAAERTREEWREYFEQYGALDGLTDKEVATLVAYLEINLPHAELSLATLPDAGVVATLNVCSGCHSPAPVLTGSMVESEWYGFFYVGHGEFVASFGLDDVLLRTMASYLGGQMPMDLDLIPEALMRGFEGY